MDKKAIKKALTLAKLAARDAGYHLIKNKNLINKTLSSTNKDIKLKADVSSEKIIKNIIKTESNYQILAEESGLSTENSPNIFWVVDPLDVTANYPKDMPICCVSYDKILFFLKRYKGPIFHYKNIEFI
tara:strand:- start:1580 stop:1966 length:387 start_codon:yes stop_codon:yes gene_type:complete